MGLVRLSAAEIARLVREREVSPVEVFEAYASRAEELNPGLNAIVSFAPDGLERARALEAALMRGELSGPLHGVPLTVKDTFDTAGLRSTSGSLVRAEYVPEHDAAAVERLRAGGAIILGKTNVPEMAATYESENFVFGRTNNPHDLSRTPGGSSGGEAAAVSAGLSAAGLGSDLTGSIRIPAHFCGIFGLKPTAGTVPGDGHCPEMIGRLKEAAAFGPLARFTQDLALLFEVLAGLPEGSMLSAPFEPEALRVACYFDDMVSPVSEEIREAVERAAHALSDAGFTVIEERPPSVEKGHALWLDMLSADVADAVRQVYKGAQDLERAGSAVRALLSRAGSAAVRTEAERLRIEHEYALARRALLEWMETTPLILAPVGASAAFKHGTRKIRVEEVEMSAFRGFSYAQTFNIFNLPALVVPAGRTPEGLPIGVQLAGKPFHEKTLLGVARVLEEALGGWQPPPDFTSTMERNPL